MRIEREMRIMALEEVGTVVMRMVGLSTADRTAWPLQEARSTQIKCKALDAKYQNVLAQVDDMVRFSLSAYMALSRCSEALKFVEMDSEKP